ncbi:MAG: DUF2341 domain-containing protein [Chitinivibrionales bacterium]
MRSLSTLVFALLAVIISCTNTPDLAGNPGTGSETTNSLTIAAAYQDGRAAAGAAVRIRQRDYLTQSSIEPDTSRTSLDTITDDEGRVTVFLDTGSYMIETNDGAGFAALVADTISFQDSVMSLPVLKQTGIVKGSFSPGIDIANAAVQVYGIERSANIDTINRTFTLQDMPEGSYTIRVSSSQSPDSAKISGVSVSPATLTSIGSVDYSWPHSQTIRLNTTPGGAGIAKTQHNFPVLIRLHADNIDFNTLAGKEHSIRFVRNGDTLLHEMELLDFQNKQAAFWVAVDTIRGNSITTLSMIWGNPDANDLSDGSAVFDTANGYEGVWHLSDSFEEPASDATRNAYDAVGNNITSEAHVWGAIGRAKRFDGTTAYYEVPNSFDSRLNFGVNDTFTLSAWAYAEQLDTNYHDIISKGNHQYGLQLNKSGDWTLHEFRNRIGWDTTFHSASAGVWTHLAGVFTGSGQQLYVNGILVDNTPGTVEETDLERNEEANVFIGRRSDLSSRFFNGILDEIRISSQARDLSWIRLCFENQRQDQTFVEIQKTAP